MCGDQELGVNARSSSPGLALGLENWSVDLKDILMARGVFITGTDTGVGKTYVSVLALRMLRSCGVDVGAMKPIETGLATAGSGSVAGDAELLLEAAGAKDEMRLVVPYRLKAPVAPLVAARKEGIEISPSKIQEAFDALSSRHNFVVVEGAGGLLVPITESYGMSDLAGDLGLPLLVVAVSKLGAVNHSALTLEACRARDLKVAGLVLNNISANSDEARSTNRELLRELVPEPVLELSYGAGVGDAGGLRELLLGIAGVRFESGGNKVRRRL